MFVGIEAVFISIEIIPLIIDPAIAVFRCVPLRLAVEGVGVFFLAGAPQVTFHSVQADAASASATWEAVYTFPKTGRPVHNKVQASFELRDGLIVRHRDDFDLYRWTRMALGPVGAVLGWTPIMQNQVRAQSAALLRRYRAG